MKKRIKKQADVIYDYLKENNFGSCTEFKKNHYRDLLIAFTNSCSELEPLLFGLGLEVFIDYSMKRQTKEAVLDQIEEWIDGTDDITGNDADAKNGYETLRWDVEKYL